MLIKVYALLVHVDVYTHLTVQSVECLFLAGGEPRHAALNDEFIRGIGDVGV